MTRREAEALMFLTLDWPTHSHARRGAARCIRCQTNKIARGGKLTRAKAIGLMMLAFDAVEDHERRAFVAGLRDAKATRRVLRLARHGRTTNELMAIYQETAKCRPHAARNAVRRMQRQGLLARRAA